MLPGALGKRACGQWTTASSQKRSIRKKRRDQVLTTAISCNQYHQHAALARYAQCLQFANTQVYANPWPKLSNQALRAQKGVALPDSSANAPSLF